MADEERNKAAPDERAYLLDTTLIPEIPDFIEEKFEGVMDMFTSYASRAHLADGVLESEQGLTYLHSRLTATRNAKTARCT